jgi:hypothetical protein
MEYLKEQQAGTRKPKNPGKIPYQSKAMQAKNAEYHRALDEIDQERDPVCQGCGRPEFEHSHSLPRNYRNHEFIANKKNIWRLCRDCHVGYENGYLWALDCGLEIMQNIWRLDEDYYRQKVMQVAKRLDAYKKKNWLAISQGSITIPKWTKEMVSDICFE